jgi:NADPH2:quinone reductase
MDGDACNAGETFSCYNGPAAGDRIARTATVEDEVLVRVTAAGVTPLDCTILSGGHPRAKAPLVLGNEGAGLIEDAGASGLSMGSPNPKLEEPLDACASNLSLWR